MLIPGTVLYSQLPPLLPEAANLTGGAKQEPNVRAIDIDDLGAVDKFVRNQPWVKIYPWETISFWKEMLQNSACAVYIAEDFQKKIIGCAFCFLGPRGQLSHVAIDPDHQGNGIGKKMLDASLRWFMTKGIGEVSVTVADKNQAGREFWSKHDFKLITAEGGKSVVMVKKI